MTKQQAGQLGGRATFDRHGREHMSAIGKLGFAAIATFARGGRRAALARLASRGRITPHYNRPDLTPAEFEALYEAIERGDDQAPPP